MKRKQKWSPEKERVVREAMRFYTVRSSGDFKFVSMEYQNIAGAFDKACAALSKARASRGRKAT